MHICVIINVMARHLIFQIDVIFGNRYKEDEAQSSDAS